MPENESMDGLGSANFVLFEAFRLDPPGGGLFRLDHAEATTPVSISSRALDLLGLLVERQGQLVSKDEIMEAVWPGTVVEEGNLTVQISALRRILDENREEGSCIQTVPGRGYRFVAPVRRVGTAARSQSTPSSGNGSGRPILDNAKLQDPAPLRRIRSTPGRIWRAQRGRRGRIMAVIGALCLVSVAAAGVRWHSPWSGEARSVPRLSIVVLPFTNLGNHPDQEYLVDAITEDLTTDLSRITDSFVISRNTAFTYRKKPADTKQIGRELGVRYVLEGSVQRSGNQVRVNIQLIDAETDAHLWADRFDRDIGDMFALQNDITGRIAVALDGVLIGAETSRATDHPDALDFILRGRAALLKPLSRDRYAEGISLFERALALDPRSAEVQSRLASALVGRVLDELSASAPADIARAEALIGQALVASPLSPLAHFAKGQLLRAKGRCDEAISEYETALASNRNWASALANIGRCKIYVGPIEEAPALEEQAIRLSPLDPQIGVWYFRIGQAHLVRSRIEEAIVWLEKARSANPALAFVHRWLGSAYTFVGDTERAAAEIAEARRLNGSGSPLSIAQAKASTARDFMAPAIRTLFETTYLAGLRNAGVPEE
jgi:TolB-like protein/DNA-binding winged helix-turn-helix (wHTH) protein